MGAGTQAALVAGLPRFTAECRAALLQLQLALLVVGEHCLGCVVLAAGQLHLVGISLHTGHDCVVGH